jgi:hypothetical protein
VRVKESAAFPFGQLWELPADVIRKPLLNNAPQISASCGESPQRLVLIHRDNYQFICPYIKDKFAGAVTEVASPTKNLVYLPGGRQALRWE